VIAAALSHWHGSTWQTRRLPGWRFEAALRILQELASAQRLGQTMNLAWLRKRVALGLEEMEELLDRLAQAKFVYRTEKDAWLLSRAPQDIRAADVFQLFVFDTETATESSDTYHTLLSKFGAEQRAALTPTLADLMPNPQSPT
jgi:DNA-binding IscR family transcriptional regulator